jgi:CubicO group peptidase (beta-lactamase class C family)
MTDHIASALPTIESELEQLVLEERLPGLCVGIVVDQELAWSRGLGTRDLASGEPADEHTLHRVASITKTLTTAAVLQLRDRGGLSLDDTLQEHIPEFASVREVAGRRDDVTLRRLLTHRAGLVTETPLPTWSASEFPSRDEILAALPDTEIVLPADHAFKYSNLAFGLLGEVIARVSGQDYFEYVQQHLLDPLQMTDSIYWLPEDQRHRMAVGYSPDLFRDQLKPAPYVGLGGVAACGQLHSSVADLARWISLQFRSSERAIADDVLSSSTLDQFHQPQYSDPDWSAAQCLGWRSLRVGNNVYHGHGGGIFGFSSHVLFSRQHRIGAIALANLWPYPLIQSITVRILERLLGNPDPPPLEPPARNPTETTTSRPTAAETSADSLDTDDRAGLYVAEPGVPVHVAMRDGDLHLEISPLWPYPLHTGGVLEPTDDDATYRVRGGRGAGELAIFETDATGHSTAFTLGGFTYRRVM